MGPLSSLAPRSLLALAAFATYGSGCERKVQEPMPEVHPLEAPVAAPAKPWGSRCVKETPAVARRLAPSSPDPRCPADPETPPKLRMGTVTFPGDQGEVVTVEIAENDHDRQRGLMYRKSMPAQRGMIFYFAQKDDHAFWMHNTCIPLDMLYLDSDGLIVGIEENTPTMSDDTFAVGCASQYVLELNAGWARAHGVKAGQKVKIEGI